MPRQDALTAVVALALGLVPALAGAQTAGIMPVGTCTGTVTANITFAAFKNGNTGSTPDSISASYAASAFGRAECDCNPDEASRDGLYARLQISTGLPAGTVTNVSAWVGSGCDNYQTRVNTSAVSCKEFRPSNLNSSSFNPESGNLGVSNAFDIWIPARDLFSPSTGSCEVDGANSVWIFIGTDFMAPEATCKIPVSERAIGPSAAVDPSAASGDKALVLSWSGPSTLNTTALRAPFQYQVLCADANGMPLRETPEPPAYSICTAEGLKRRQTVFGATNISVVPGDGGTSTADLGLGSSSSALHEGVPHDEDMAGADLAGADLAGVDLGSTDMALSPGPRPRTFPELGPFATLDPKFVCGSFKDATTTQTFSERIDGLTNEATYQLVVLSIDAYGNPTPSALITGTPRAVDDLYARYRAAGGSAQGFCFVATAAYGDYDHPQVRVLRAFRDEILATSAPGRAFVRGYYATSPPLAHFIAEGSLRRAVARALLWPLVGLAALALQLGSLTLALLVAGGLPAGLLWLRRRRRASRQLTEALA